MTQPISLDTLVVKPRKLNYKVRFNDCDPMGHLNNSKYIDYFINGMEDFMFVNYNIELSKELKKGTGWVVRDHQILYLKPAKNHDEIKIEIAFVKLLEKEFEVEMRMYNHSKEKILSMMRSNFSCIDSSVGRRKAHPEHFFFAAYNALNPDLAEYKTLEESYRALRKNFR